MKLLLLIASLAMIGAVLELVRRRRLREEFSWLWLAGSLGALTLGLWGRARQGLADLLEVGEAEAVLVATLLFVVLICLDLSAKASSLANQSKHLAQELTRIEGRLQDLEETPREP